MTSMESDDLICTYLKMHDEHITHTTVFFRYLIYDNFLTCKSKFGMINKKQTTMATVIFRMQLMVSCQPITSKENGKEPIVPGY